MTPTNEWRDCWKKPVKVQYREITETAEIETREGKLYGYAGKDVLLKGVKGEVYPCKIDIFNATYTTTKPLTEEEIREAERKKIVKLIEEVIKDGVLSEYDFEDEDEVAKFIINEIEEID
jgi:DNA repair exonuclease SbcCD nuclease subunit